MSPFWLTLAPMSLADGPSPESGSPLGWNTEQGVGPLGATECEPALPLGVSSFLFVSPFVHGRPAL